MAQTVFDHEAKPVQDIKVPETHDEAESLMQEIQSAQRELRSRIGALEDRRARHYAAINLINQEIKKKGGETLSEQQKKRTQALAKYIHTHRLDLLNGKREGTVNFPDGQVEVIYCTPDAIYSILGDEHASGLEFIDNGYRDGTYVRVTYVRQAINRDWPEFDGKIQHTGKGNNIKVKVKPNVKFLTDYDNKRLEETFPPDATE